MNSNDTTDYSTLVENNFIIEEFVKRNYLKVNIFLGTKSTMQTTEQPKLDPQTMISSLGGAISVFLGISIISAFEFIELLIRLLIRLCAGSRDNQ